MSGYSLVDYIMLAIVIICVALAIRELLYAIIVDIKRRAGSDREW